MKIRNWIYFALCLIAVLFVTLFSKSTSPLYDLYDNLDSYMYQTIGKCWIQGYLPYVDLWDQKGPLIYVINAAGYWLTGNRTGVYLIQLLFMLATVFFMYKFYRLTFKPLFAFDGVLFSLFCLYNLYAEGNHVEEYLLPFLVLAWYFQFIWVSKYIKSKDAKHSPWQAAFYGFILAFCLFTRLTNALGVCGGVAFIAIVLLINCEVKNLAQNAIAFIGGFLILFLPVSGYFYVHDAFDEMWYGTFLFNLNYASHPLFGFSESSTVSSLFRTFIDVYCCLGTAFLLFLTNNRKKILGVWMLSISFFVWMWLFNSHGFIHYGMICVPYSILILTFLYYTVKANNPLHYKLTFACVLVIYVVMNVSKLFLDLPVSEMDKEEETLLLKNIPQEEYNSIAIYDLGPYLYLRYNIIPVYKYFSTQSLTLSYSESSEHLNRVMNEFSTCRAKWILLPEWSAESCAIRPIIDCHYEMVVASENCFFYKLKDK